MRFTVSSTALSSRLSALSRVVNSQSGLPMKGGFLFEGSGSVRLSPAVSVSMAAKTFSTTNTLTNTASKEKHSSEQRSLETLVTQHYCLMAKSNSKKPSVKQQIELDSIIGATMDTLSLIIMDEGVNSAKSRWQALNDSYSRAYWWPPVAEAAYKLFRNQPCKQAEHAPTNVVQPPQAVNINIVGGDMRAGGPPTYSIGHVGQMVGVNEGDVVYTKEGGPA